MFWINEKLGIAFESCEGGRAVWSSEDKDFTRLMTRDERRRCDLADCKRVSESKARAFMLA
ncbi:MAG: hypothetical protein IJV69_05360, partial [Kiritimatiellae bacterium]|nr:hypothetical protein [Kiritimatiellia bacterium]